MSMTAPAPAIPAVAGRDSLARWSAIIAAGMVASNLALPDALDLPIKNLLRTELNLGRDKVSLFFTIAALPWYFKILAGLLSDSFPLFGTRRRHYLIFSGALAAAGWLLVGAVSHAYWPLLFALMATNAMLVFISTVTAALMVEAGKRRGIEDRLVTVRIMTESACGVVAGPIAGYLATRPFGWTGVAGALIALTVVPAALFVLREPPVAQRDVSALRDAGIKLREALGSRSLWRTALFLALVLTPQSFSSPLYFHQVEQLGFANIDVGYLNSLSALASIATAAVYAAIRPRLTLRTLTIASLLLGAGATGSLMFYRSWEAALVIESLRGVFNTVGTLAVMEAAVRATPVSIAAMGFALLTSAWNVGLALGDYIGAWIVQRGILSFYGLAALFAVLSAMSLLALPLLPRSVFVEPAPSQPQ
ncbi:MAG: MFS transporter [Alphaproteobacteria bacterium]